MTRADALRLIQGYVEINDVLLGDIFSAFGFVWAHVGYGEDGYRHPKFNCGFFTVSDDENKVLTEAQKAYVGRMIQILLDHEKRSGIQPE